MILKCTLLFHTFLRMFCSALNDFCLLKPPSPPPHLQEVAPSKFCSALASPRKTILHSPGQPGHLPAP